MDTITFLGVFCLAVAGGILGSLQYRIWRERKEDRAYRAAYLNRGRRKTDR